MSGEESKYFHVVKVFLENIISDVVRNDSGHNQSSKQDFEQKMPGVSAPVADTV